MKKFYLLVVLVLFVASLNAQRIDAQYDFSSPVTGIDESQARQARDLGAQLLQERNAQDRGGDVFFMEDFSEGLDGTTPFGAWTIEDSGGGTIWMVADPDGPQGEVISGTNIGPLESTTASNGWMIFDADLHNTPQDDGVEDVEGSLISPVIDMSGLNSVVLEWEQYFAYCCFPLNPLFIEVSNDGGDSWVVFPANGEFIEAANTLSANPQPTQLDISCVAAGESEVQIKFSYLQNPAIGQGYTHYFWGVDDVVIRENTISDDLRITQLTTGDIFNYYEYRNLPLEQAIPEDEGGLKAGVIYRNAGFNDQTNVVITVDILDDGGNVISTIDSEPFVAPAAANAETCPQNLTDTLYIDTGWEPETVGDYTVRATISQDETDVDETNNTRERPISFTDDEYSHDDEDLWNTEFRPREDEGTFDPTGYGNFYLANNPGTFAHGALVAFGPNTSENFLEFELRFYTVQPDQTLNDANFEISFHTIAPEYVPNNIAGAQLVYYPFEEAIEMEVANPLDDEDDIFYFVSVVNDFPSETDELTVVGVSSSDTDNSTGVYELSGGGSFVWFTSQTATPAVRLVTSERVSVDEIANMNGVELKQNVPNPANATTAIEFFLSGSKEVIFEVFDAQGRLIDQDDMGTLQGGEHRIVYPVNELQSGVYYYTLTVNGARLTKKMIVQRN